MAGFTDKTSASYSIAIKTENHAEVTDAVNKSIDDYVLINNLSNCSFFWLRMLLLLFQAMSASLFIIQVFCYGFIALMILISFVNILNTVTTGIDLRRREFAMFKSVGITPKGFNKMICLESLLYGIKALVISIPVSILLSFLMNVLLGSDQIPFTVNVPLLSVGGCCCFFVLVGSGMLLAVSKLKKIQ
ncbi:MAG: ABC transporter permease [Anaerotruncus sp.]|nr:MAG: ABC transporter permease [Anaerotruncus sp.]